MCDIAANYALVNEKGNSLAWLEKAFEISPAAVLTAKADRRFDSIRSDQRFAALMKRMNL